MRYRALSASGDYQYGRTGLFLVDSPAAVAQAIQTRLKLMTQEWFLDLAEGTDYSGKILGAHTQNTRDIEIKSRILNTPGVLELATYYSVVSADRSMTVTATVITQYGITPVTVEVSA